MTPSRPRALLELALVFVPAAAIMAVGWRIVGSDPLARQAVVWVAYVAMLGAIWIGLHLRGQTWAHFGLRVGPVSGRTVARAVLVSIAVFAVALAAFVVGAMLTAPLAAAGAPADMSGYEYLRGNLPMLLVALAAVYVVSSFGEEAVYRGFLVTRLAELGGETRGAWGTAVVISGIAFGMAHFGWGVAGVLQTTLMGLALAAAYLVVKRNLWVLVLAHAYMDTLLLVQLYRGAPPP